MLYSAEWGGYCYFFFFQFYMWRKERQRGKVTCPGSYAKWKSWACVQPSDSRPFTANLSSRLPPYEALLTTSPCRDHTPHTHLTPQTCPVATSHKANRLQRRSTESSSMLIFMSSYSWQSAEIIYGLGRNTQKDEGSGESPSEQLAFTRLFHKRTLHWLRVTFVWWP